MTIPQCPCDLGHPCIEHDPEYREYAKRWTRTQSSVAPSVIDCPGCVGDGEHTWQRNCDEIPFK